MRLSLALIATAILCTACIKQEDFTALQHRVAAQEQKILAQKAELDTLRTDQDQTASQVTEVRPVQADMWAEFEDIKVRIASLSGRVESLEMQTRDTSRSASEREVLVKALEERTRRLEILWHQAASLLALDIESMETDADRALHPEKYLQPQANATAVPMGNGTFPADAMGNGTVPAQPQTQADDIPNFLPVVHQDELPKDLQDKLGQESVALEAPGTPAKAQNDSLPAAQPEPQPEAKPQADPAKLLYDKALAAFKQRKYAAARAAWNEVAETFPKHALVPNALFWQGECFYQEGDYARAVLAYQEVISKYPDSGKYPSSLLKQGISFMKLKKTKAGTLILNDVIKKFPDSPEAKRAKSYIANKK